MSNLIGSWQDEASAIWTIESEAKLLKVFAVGGRGPFKGSEHDFSNAVIYVNFSDVKPETGVLSDDKKIIYWGNGTRWTKL